MDVSEITNFQYGQFNPFHKPSPQSQGDNMPVTNISWKNAVKYCEWRSKRNNAVYRLPYEAEWEKAARGGEKRTFSWGYTYSKNNTRANLNSETAVSATSFKPNPYGLYNMSGNVWEWCIDWYSPDYYKKTVSRNPAGPVKGTYRIVRGGSFRFSEKSCRTYERNAEKPDSHVFDIGFRCIRIVIKEEEEEKEEAEEDIQPGVILK